MIVLLRCRAAPIPSLPPTSRPHLDHLSSRLFTWRQLRPNATEASREADELPCARLKYRGAEAARVQARPCERTECHGQPVQTGANAVAAPKQCPTAPTSPSRKRMLLRSPSNPSTKGNRNSVRYELRPGQVNNGPHLSCLPMLAHRARWHGRCWEASLLERILA